MSEMSFPWEFLKRNFMINAETPVLRFYVVTEEQDIK